MTIELPNSKALFKNKPIKILSRGCNLTQVCYEGDEDNPFSVMEKDLKPIPVKKRPGYISVDDLTWDAEGCLAWYLGWLAGVGNARFYLETTPGQQNKVEALYNELTGTILLPAVGLYNLALGNKFGTEAGITFVPTNEMPDDIAKLQKQREGFINRVEFFWALIRVGFRLTKASHDVGLIHQAVPESQQHFFDRGLRGEERNLVDIIPSAA